MVAGGEHDFCWIGSPLIHQSSSSWRVGKMFKWHFCIMLWSHFWSLHSQSVPGWPLFDLDLCDQRTKGPFPILPLRFSQGLAALENSTEVLNFAVIPSSEQGEKWAMLNLLTSTISLWKRNIRSTA